MSSPSTEPPESDSHWEMETHHRRGERRSPYDALVRVVSPSGGVGVALNKSDSGIRVVVDCQLSEGQCCSLHLIDRNGTERYEQMRVAWSRRLRDGWVVGLERLGLN